MVGDFLHYFPFPRPVPTKVVVLGASFPPWRKPGCRLFPPARQPSNITTTSETSVFWRSCCNASLAEYGSSICWQSKGARLLGLGE